MRVPLVLVSGSSGSCKSAVCHVLKRRGYEAHDTDQDENAVWVNRTTGEVAVMSDAPEVKSPAWLEEQEWRVVPRRVEALVKRADDRLVFLCGSTATEKEVRHLFSRVIYLAIDNETLRHRLASRTTNAFGKAPNELEAILAWHKVGEDEYRRFGAVIVNATLPLREVVDDVLAAST